MYHDVILFGQANQAEKMPIKCSPDGDFTGGVAAECFGTTINRLCGLG